VTGSTLEQRLAQLATALDAPPPPDVARIVAVLPERSARRRRRRPAARALALAFAVVLAAAATALAVPSSRHAVLRVLGLEGERIVQTPSPTPIPPRTARRLGRRIALGRVRHAASFTALTTPRASAAYLAHDLPGGRVTLVAGHTLIIEFRGDTGAVLGKLVGVATYHRRVRVDGAQGVYLYGAPHELFYLAPGGSFRQDTVRLAGNVLVWQQGALTVRIEGTRTLAQALALARTLR